MDHKCTPIAGTPVCPIALGGSYFDPVQFAGEKRRELLRTMESALELGINHFDTAAGYASGESERVLGEFVRTCGAPREAVFVATKSAVDEMDSGLMHAAVEQLKPLAAETGRTLVELGIRWVLAQTGVTAAVVGARNEQQARANVAALEGDIPGDVFDRMTAISDAVQPFFPDIPNMYNHLP